jgi:beta-lactamase regulating signal transducer with metallopeptidase domain
MTVLHAMLGNAAVAAVVALLVLAIGCVCHSPAVRHGAWILVLLKLVTPPLFDVPLYVLPASWDIPPAESAPPASRVFLFVVCTPDSRDSPADGAARESRGWGDGIQEAKAGWCLVAVWLSGAAVWFIWQGRRIVRFRRRVGRAENADPQVVVATRRIASALGVTFPPAVKVATGIGSPMLWGWGRGTVVLFPRELLAQLAPEARDTLLAHELAHFLRRDHWVRALEFLATGLYWWHPAVWLARAGIAAAEEECCDAWVVGGLSASPRRYAEALLATVDFAAELRRPCLPPGASAASRSARLLRRRLIGILHAERPGRLRGAVVIRAAAAALLLIQPVLRATTTEAGARSQESADWSQTIVPNSFTLNTGQWPSRPRRSTEPPAWATATAPGGAVTALARDREVVLRRADGTVTILGPGKPLALAFAPHGHQLATAGPGSLVRTWDDRGSLLATACVPAPARAITYTPDGTRILVLDAAGGISVRHPETLAPLTRWSVEGTANSIACAPDGRTVAVACGSWLDETGWVECWSINERQKQSSFAMGAPVGATRFAPDGGMLVIGGWNGSFAWRKVPGGELVAERQLAKDLVAAAAFSPDAGTLPLDPPPEPEPPPVPAPFSGTDLFRGISQLPKR